MTHWELRLHHGFRLRRSIIHYLLFYEKVPNHADREAPLRSAHLNYVLAAVRRGELVLGGSLGDPDGGSVAILFRADSAATAESFAVGDPYVVEGVVCRWWVQAWQTVVGKDAAVPLQQ